MKLPIAKEGLNLIKIFVLLAIGCYILGRSISSIFYFLSAVFLVLFLFSLYFFRDPERDIKLDKNVILSPADGKVLDIVETDGAKTVKIFMSVLNVHIQRAPMGGMIESIEYKPGKFLPADRPEVEQQNEQNVILIRDNERNLELVVKQIAGILARRIVCWIKKGTLVTQGQRIGMIKFGSQVDLVLPREIALNVENGSHVKAGITMIGRFS